MTFLAALFVRLGLSQRVSSILAYVAVIGLGIVLLWALCAGLIAHGKALGKHECEIAQLAASNDALIANDKAKDRATTEQQADAARITSEQAEVNHAIDTAPSSIPGAATRAANCILWRQQHPSAVPPAACR